jgi:hypothetical protein
MSALRASVAHPNGVGRSCRNFPATRPTCPVGPDTRPPGRLFDVLLKEIRAIAGDALVLSPQDRAAEDANTTWFGAPPHERMGMSASEVVAAFEEAAEALREKVTAAGHPGPATFYVWHHGQAGQLRCSISSAPPDDLPFDDAYQVTSDLHAIVEEFLLDRAPGAINWGSLDPIPYQPGDPEPTVDAVSVWACDLCTKA